MNLEQCLFVIACGFASFRLCELITKDEGPASVFFKLRLWAGSYDLDDNQAPVRLIGRLLACPYCVGVYAAFALALFVDRTWTFPITWFAIAGLQAFLQSTGGRT